ncbi:tRNA-dihydrouridine synthase [Shimia sediminis]|uniref:oxidoreductase n=1 Tax=Shimia sediminis TaxID=2497945 RepID=UPI001F4159CC|nr:tRNA-dihydrouridine synthase [Shimia sediminis]
MSVTKMSAAEVLGQPLDLPCGGQLKNRLVKSAMSDSLGDGEGNPTAEQARLYERWAMGGVALSVIGEVQTSPDYPEKPGNLVLAPGVDMAALKTLALRGAADGAHLWPQLGHAGALAYDGISRPKGPSPLNVPGLVSEALSLGEIRALPGAFARSAGIAREAGFGGVLLHAGHGFLFSQFLSPLFNHRTDAYGGSVANRFRIVAEVISAVRDAVGRSFPVGIRINATDQLVGGLTQADALEVVDLLDQTSIDLIDISGGTYFPGAASSSEGRGTGPYFVEFSRAAKARTSIPIMVTGGFKTRTEAAEAVRTGAADAVGVARAMVLNPSLADDWLRQTGGDPVFPGFETPPKGGITAWYSMRMTALGQDAEEGFDLGLPEALQAYDTRDAMRSLRWKKRFNL